MKTAVLSFTAFVLAVISSVANAQTIEDLCTAVDNNNMSEVQRLVALPAVDVNAVCTNLGSPDDYSDQRTPLIWAARYDYAEIADALIAAAANVNAADSFNNTPLILAAREGYAGIVDALIAANANLDFHNNNGSTALHRAANNGHLAVVNALIAAGADLYLLDNTDHTALDLANDASHTEVVAALTAADAAQMQVDGLCSAVSDRNLPEVQRLAGMSGIDVDGTCSRSRSGAKPLHWATENNDVAVVEALIDAGADVNVRNDSNRTPPALGGYCRK